MKMAQNKLVPRLDTGIKQAEPEGCPAVSFRLSSRRNSTRIAAVSLRYIYLFDLILQGAPRSWQQSRRER